MAMQPMLEFQVGDHSYRARKLNAFQQMHVLKRIGPPFLKLLREQAQAAPEEDGTDENAVALATAAGMERFLSAMHDMSDDDIDFVVMTCAAMVQRQLVTGNGTAAPAWGPIFEPRAKVFMFDDLQNLGDVMMIVSHVVRDNLAGFLPIRPPEVEPAGPTRPTLAASNM